MLTTVTAGPYTIRGLSLAGIHTSLFVRELDALFDVGIAARSNAATPQADSVTCPARAMASPPAVASPCRTPRVMLVCITSAMSGPGNA